MSETALIYPMFAMFAVTFLVLLALFKTRVQSVRTGRVDPAYFLTYSTLATEPDRARQLSRHFSNIFEAPTLFYAVCILAMITDATSLCFVSLAWVYVLLRAAHAIIHVGKNQLRPRIAAYFGSWIILAAMWGLILLSAIGDG